MTRPSLIIFDCDGVLVDTEVITNQLLVDNLAQHGLSLNVDDAMELFVGGSLNDVKVEAERRGALLPDDWMKQFYSVLHARLHQGIDPIAGVPELLTTLQSHAIPFCVASNGSDDKMQITLGQNGLIELFENAMFSAHTHNTWKPDPELFLLAAEAFGFEPSQCVVIEDSANGTLAAQRAGMTCFAYCPLGPDKRLIANGGIPFETMQHLPEMLGLI